MHSKLSIAISALISGGAALSPQLAQAQAKDDAALDEVVVTARLRSERLQEVPVAVSAFNAKAIEDAGIERAGDYVALVPNVTLAKSQDAGTSFMTIRGLTQVRNGESPVAFVVDGVLSINPIQFTQELFDVEQIEVLKGPQGALYGRNAIGGAITIATKQPTNEFEGRVRVGAGNGDLLKAQATASGPIVKDKLLARVSVSQEQADGYIENVYLRDKVDGFTDKNGRLLLKWLPSENLAVDLRTSFSDTTGGALYFVVNSDLYAGGPDFVGDANNTSVPIETNVRGVDDRKLRDASLKIDYHTSIGTLTSISAWSSASERSAGDNAPYSSTPADGTQDGEVDVKGWSQELRLTSAADRRLRYIVGGYYLTTNRDYVLTLGIDDGAGILVPGINPPGSVNATTFYLKDHQDSDAYALFAQLNYDVTKQFELSAAGRYDSDKRTLTDRKVDAPSRSAKFGAFQPKVTATYKPTRDLTLYAVFSKGFRSGGFNAAGVADLAAAAVPPVLGVKDIFDKESSTNYEVGVKAQLLDEKLRISGAVFQTDVSNQDYFSFIASVGAQIITNIDAVDLRGFEFEAAFKPLSGLVLSAGYGYTDSEIKKYRVDPTVVGNSAPYVPRYTVNLGAQYSLSLPRDLRLTARTDYERRGPQFWSPENSTQRDPIDLVVARLTLGAAHDNWALTLWSRNLLNERYNAEFVSGGFAFLGTPRTYGLEFSKRF
jgi:iron complex outermembrane receptor protein